MFADGVGNLLSGLAGTVPNSTYASGVSIVELTGVAARAVGVCVGLLFAAMAFVPKLAAVLVAIPGPVVAAYFVVILALLFMFGLKILQNEALDYRNSLVVGLAFWIGIAFELDWIFPEYFRGGLSELIGNGMTVGGMTVIALTLFRELTGPRRQRLRVALTVDAYPKIDAYLAGLGARKRWNDELVERIRAVGEEALFAADREGRRPGGRRRAALAADRPCRGGCRGAGVHRRDRRGQSRGPDGGAGPAGGGRADGAGGVTPAAAALRVVGAPLSATTTRTSSWCAWSPLKPDPPRGHRAAGAW